ncbi:MAG: hypothetical protein AAGJ08_24845 [Cyanobacteria bacterium P01_H01_bin.35]
MSYIFVLMSEKDKFGNLLVIKWPEKLLISGLWSCGKIKCFES